MKKRVPPAALATAILVGAILFALATNARGAAHRSLVAGIDMSQTCAGRVEPGARIDFEALVRNTGDEVLDITAIDADAGTPEITGDDVILTEYTGDTDGDGDLDPGEQWTYPASFTAPNEDVTNIVSVEAISLQTGDNASDLAPCETDVIQQPAPGEVAGVREVSGTVLIKKAGTTKFVELSGTTEIPIGSQVNTLNGTVMLTAGLGGGRTNSAEFYQGVFTILQSKARGAYMTLRLEGGNFRNCTRRSSGALSVDARRKRAVRRVWGSGRGRFTTRGRYSSATVRGTKWLTLDRCDGTLTRVLQGIVRVRDFRARKNVNVRAGRSYLARAPGA